MRRTKRMLEITNFDYYYFTFCDRRDCTDGLMKEFHALPHKNKLSFGLNIVEGLGENQHIKVYDKPNGK